MKPYLDHVRAILSDDNSVFKPGGRNGIDTISLFGYQNSYNLSQGFPLVTTKKLFYRGMLEEILWFLRGESNVRSLQQKNVHYWDPWADENGDLGPVYGYQWRKWEAFDPDSYGAYHLRHIDQIREALDLIKTQPDSRRIIISAWNVADLPKMALAPCHLLSQFNVRDGKLDCQMYQRSADMFLGVPFNIACYSILTTLFAQQSGLQPGRFIHTFGDSHIYCGPEGRSCFYQQNLAELKSRVKSVQQRQDYLEVIEWINQSAPKVPEDISEADHVPKMLLQLSREPQPLPKLTIASKPLEQLVAEDFKIENYNPHPAIKGKVAV